MTDPVDPATENVKRDENGMLISVAVPTHNRPQLLREALLSIAAQTHPQWEVVVVDDGSTPPVLESTLRELLGEHFVLVRHAQAQGIAAAKNAGVAAAHGDVVLHLDDDDLLTPTALEKINSVYELYPDIECLFINVEPFGRYEKGTAENQSQALYKLLERIGGIEENRVFLFNKKLFPSLLKSVPIALQRPAARKYLWDMVGMLRKDSYMPEPEWAMKVALMARSALLLDKVSQFRVDGQNYVSQADLKYKHMLAAVDIRNSLLLWITEHSEFSEHYREIRYSLSDVYFDQAYVYQQNRNLELAWRPLFYSLFIHPQWCKFRFIFRLLLSYLR